MLASIRLLHKHPHPSSNAQERESSPTPQLLVRPCKSLHPVPFLSPHNNNNNNTSTPMLLRTGCTMSRVCLTVSIAPSAVSTEATQIVVVQPQSHPLPLSPLLQFPE